MFLTGGLLPKMADCHWCELCVVLICGIGIICDDSCQYTGAIEMPGPRLSIEYSVRFVSALTTAVILSVIA